MQLLQLEDSKSSHITLKALCPSSLLDLVYLRKQERGKMWRPRTGPLTDLLAIKGVNYFLLG